MLSIAKSGIKKAARSFGFEITPVEERRYADFDEELSELIRAVAPYTLTTPERIEALVNAIRYIEKHGIAGDIAECGVWRGGSIMTVIKVLLSFNSTERNIYLYDTFEGMSAPTDEDRSFDNVSASRQMEEESAEDQASVWCRAGLDEVRDRVLSLGYPEEKIHFIRGKVEETIPDTLPGPLALLRLDTDFYESTRHELQHLYPLLSHQGIMIVDDYGHWQGCRQAVDEYFATLGKPVFLNRIDYTGRIMVKHS